MRTTTRWSPIGGERSGLYRPRVPDRIPRSVPDEEFNEIFARLPSHRDRALVAFYVSTGARASELLSATVAGLDPGRQLITVVRKGTRELQQLPASTDAFVWLRLYQVEMEELIPKGRRQPLWWTLRRPARPLAYHAVHRMFERVNQRAGTSATLHSLRHTAAYRMAEDPGAPADRRATRPGSCPAHDHPALPHSPQRGRDPPGAGPSRRADPAGSRAGPARARARATGPGPWTSCSGTGHRDHRGERAGAGAGRDRGPSGNRHARASPPGLGRGLAGDPARPRGSRDAADQPAVRPRATLAPRRCGAGG